MVGAVVSGRGGRRESAWGEGAGCRAGCWAEKRATHAASLQRFRPAFRLSSSGWASRSPPQARRAKDKGRGERGGRPSRWDTEASARPRRRKWGARSRGRSRGGMRPKLSPRPQAHTRASRPPPRPIPAEWALAHEYTQPGRHAHTPHASNGRARDGKASAGPPPAQAEAKKKKTGPEPIGPCPFAARRGDPALSRPLCYPSYRLLRRCGQALTTPAGGAATLKAGRACGRGEAAGPRPPAPPFSSLLGAPRALCAPDTPIPWHPAQG